MVESTKDTPFDYDPKDLIRIKLEVEEVNDEKVLLFIRPDTAVGQTIDESFICFFCKSVANPPVFDVNCG